MQKKKIIKGLLLLLAVSGAGWWFWQEPHPSVEARTQEAGQPGDRGAAAGGRRGGRGGGNRPVPVLVTAAKTGNLRIVQTAVGTVVPSAVVTVRSRVNGQLVKVLFKEGQLVKAGELLAELDPRPFQVQLTQVQGQALRNQALLRNTELDLERYKTLQAQDSIASQQVDAQASLVQQYKGTVLADQGLVDNAKLQLSFTRIVAPFNGRVGLRPIDVGNNITTTDALAVVNAVDPIHVVFTLPEDRVANLVQRLQATRKSGAGLPVEVWDRSNTTLLDKGSLLSLDNQIDTTSGTIKLKAQFKNDKNTLFPNQFVNVRLLSDTQKEVIMVSSAAIQHGSAGAYVYLLTDDVKGKKVVVTPVTVGGADGDQVCITQGLHVGDQVVISGIDKLRDGAKVIVSSGKAGAGGREHRRNGAGGGQRHRPEAAA